MRAVSKAILALIALLAVLWIAAHWQQLSSWFRG
jgi:hypothetical protein